MSLKVKRPTRPKEGRMGHPRKTPLRGWALLSDPVRGLTATPNITSRLRRVGYLGRRRGRTRITELFGAAMNATTQGATSARCVRPW